MAKELRTAGIDLVSRRKGTDGLVHISVCGASTGAINIYVIDRGSLPAAQRLGYRLRLVAQSGPGVRMELIEVGESGLPARGPASAAGAE